MLDGVQNFLKVENCNNGDFSQRGQVLGFRASTTQLSGRCSVWFSASRRPLVLVVQLCAWGSAGRPTCRRGGVSAVASRAGRRRRGAAAMRCVRAPPAAASVGAVAPLVALRAAAAPRRGAGAGVPAPPRHPAGWHTAASCARRPRGSLREPLAALRRWVPEPPHGKSTPEPAHPLPRLAVSLPWRMDTTDPERT